MNSMNLDTEFKYREKICPICGKDFIGTAEWVYRKGSSDHEWIFCSWKCLRKWESEKKSPMQMRETIIRMLMDGKTVAEVARELHEDRSKVAYWAAKLGVLKGADDK